MSHDEYFSTRIFHTSTCRVLAYSRYFSLKKNVLQTKLRKNVKVSFINSKHCWQKGERKIEREEIDRESGYKSNNLALADHFPQN